MQVKSIAECPKRMHSAILLTFIKLPFDVKVFVLTILKWPFYTGFTVNVFKSLQKWSRQSNPTTLNTYTHYLIAEYNCPHLFIYFPKYRLSCVGTFLFAKCTCMAWKKSFPQICKWGKLQFNLSSLMRFLFDLILYVPVNNLSVMSGWAFLGWTSTKQGLMCLAQGHNAVMPVWL